MIKVPKTELKELTAPMLGGISEHDRDEMAIPSYLHWNPMICWLMWRRYENISRMSEFSGTETVLEFGCGTGVFLPELCDKTQTVKAVDLFPQYAERLAKKRGLAVEFAQDLQNIDDNSLDAIIAADVLEHITDLAHVLEQFAAKLKPEGKLLVSGPTENLFYKIGRVIAGFGDKGDYHHTNIRHLRSEISAFGFQEQACVSLPFAALPTLFEVSRFVWNKT